MKTSLEKRIALFSFLILFLTILADTGFRIIEDRKAYVKSLQLRSRAMGTSLRTNIEYLVKMGLDLREIDVISVKCKNLVDTDPEMAYCVVADRDGRILYASDAKFLRLPLDLVQKTYDHRGRLNVIGSGARYYDSTIPVKTEDDKVVGSIHIGFPESLITGMMQASIARSGVIFLVFFGLSFAVVIVFARRNIMYPVRSLLDGVRELTKGLFDTRIPRLPQREFDELGENINIMAETLKARSDELRRQYEEMDRTHREVNESYRKLEEVTLDLEKSEEQYKSLVEYASDAIIVIGEDRVIKMVNRMAENFLGISSHVLVGTGLDQMLNLLHIENEPAVAAFLEEAFRGKRISSEIRMLRPDASLVIGMVHAVTIKSGSQRVVQAIVRDVTKERETIENLEKSAADLARLNRMKDSFLGLASHELKTPLTVIIGYSDLILNEVRRGVDKELRMMVENIANAAARLDGIVRDMVDVSMIDEKRLRLRIEDVSVNGLLESVANELKFFFTLRKQEIVLDLDPDLPHIRGDSGRLSQLAANLLGNAMKFTPDGGAVTVTTRRCRMHSASDGASVLAVEITVSDTGIGIDPDDQTRIFEKFYEAGSIDEHFSGKVAFKSKGAGLGLAISKGIVEMHAGMIWVESPGHDPERLPGSAFHILLPVSASVEDVAIDYAAVSAC
jgi:PAS domain S-box-containing protein